MCNVPPKFNQVCRLCLTLVNKHDVATLQIFDCDTSASTATTTSTDKIIQQQQITADNTHYIPTTTTTTTATNIEVEDDKTTATTTIKNIENLTMAAIKKPSSDSDNSAQLNRSPPDMVIKKNEPIKSTAIVETTNENILQCNCVSMQQQQQKECACDKTKTTATTTTTTTKHALIKDENDEEEEEDEEHVAQRDDSEQKNEESNKLTSVTEIITKNPTTTTSAPLVPSAASESAISSTHVDTQILGQIATAAATTNTPILSPTLTTRFLIDNDKIMSQSEQQQQQEKDTFENINNIHTNSNDHADDELESNKILLNAVVAAAALAANNNVNVNDNKATYNQSNQEHAEHDDSSSTTPTTTTSSSSSPHITVQILNCLSIKVSHWSRAFMHTYIQTYIQAKSNKLKKKKCIEKQQQQSAAKLVKHPLTPPSIKQVNAFVAGSMFKTLDSNHIQPKQSLRHTNNKIMSNF